MKTVLAFLLMFVSLSIFAQDLMTASEREAYVEQVAKGERRALYINGYDNVSSSINYPSKDDLDQYFSGEEQYENNLDSDEITSIYNCFHGSFCRVYQIITSSEYMGGYGVEGAFILLDIKNRSHTTLRHTIYAE